MSLVLLVSERFERLVVVAWLVFSGCFLGLVPLVLLQLSAALVVKVLIVPPLLILLVRPCSGRSLPAVLLLLSMLCWFIPNPHRLPTSAAWRKLDLMCAAHFMEAGTAEEAERGARICKFGVDMHGVGRMGAGMSVYGDDKAILYYPAYQVEYRTDLDNESPFEARLGDDPSDWGAFGFGL